MDRRIEEEYKRVSLLVNVARLYYEHDYNQSMIADKLQLSRPYISKLIAQAREEGIVTITINDPIQTETSLERQIRQRFALRKVVVVPKSHNQDNLNKVGVACARYLNSIITDGDTIGVAWGTTMFTCAQLAIQRQDLSDVTVVQLCGGVSNSNHNIYASEIPKLLAEALSGTSYLLPLPAIMNSMQVKDSVLADHSISQAIDYAKQANIALFTLGEFGTNNALAHAGYVDDHQLKQLEAIGAVGDICAHFINEDGELCDKNLDDRTISLPLDEIKKKDYRIAVAIGNQKVRSICGALNGGHLNVLITDEETATTVLKHFDK